MKIANRLAVGRFVTITRSPGGRLPKGLPERARVKLIKKELVFCDVEYEGQIFKVELPCVEGDLLYQMPDGRWLAWNHPFVISELIRQKGRN
jgi:hypothetical protein